MSNGDNIQCPVVAFRLPETLLSQVQLRMRERHFATVSEYARDLVRRDIEANTSATMDAHDAEVRP